MSKNQQRVVIGYWGKDLRTRVKCEQSLEKTRALLQDQLLGGGLRVFLWQAVHDVRNGEVAEEPGTLKCSCVKASNAHADRRCFSCHGINYIPGYRKFGYENFWVASVSPNLVLSNLQLNTTIKPHRLELTPTATQGIATSPDIFFSRTDITQLWEARSDFVVRDGANSGVVAEFSTDGGATYSSLANIAVANPITGKIRFRVTIFRSSTTTPSPQWEILRARFPTIPLVGRLGPWIVVLKTVSPDKEMQEVRGITIDSQNNNFWTAPLSLFDCRIPDQCGVGGVVDPRVIIKDPAFIEFIDGVRSNLDTSQRWSLTNVTYSDPFGYFTRQFFAARLQQEQEFTGLVF